MPIKTNLYRELKRQFGKRDADMFILAPRKYKHHFDDAALKAYQHEEDDHG